VLAELGPGSTGLGPLGLSSDEAERLNLAFIWLLTFEHHFPKRVDTVPSRAMRSWAHAVSSCVRFQTSHIRDPHCPLSWGHMQRQLVQSPLNLPPSVALTRAQDSPSPARARTWDPADGAAAGHGAARSCTRSCQEASPHTLNRVQCDAQGSGDSPLRPKAWCQEERSIHTLMHPGVVQCTNNKACVNIQLVITARNEGEGLELGHLAYVRT
jgi:hypothetical protein